MQKIQILFPEPQAQRLREAATREDRPISDIVRRATEIYLDRLAPGGVGTQQQQIPVFDGGETLVRPEKMREATYSDRIDPAP